MLVEHARNLVGIADATHAEYGLQGTAVISLLACSLQDQTITVQLAPDSRLAALYGSTQVAERTTCSYGLTPELQHIADQFGMRIAGTDETGEVRAVEGTNHPFFVGTLYQPQLTSSASAPNPVFLGLVSAVASASHPG